MKKKITTFILTVVLLAGVSLLLYPTVSDYWNGLHQSQAITHYVDSVSAMSPESYEQEWKAAKAFNEKLSGNAVAFEPDGEQSNEYYSLLNVSDTNVMGYVEIPAIDCMLPIYHGTDESVLQIAVGHLEWSSLPTGGAGTHTVLSGHRGLPSAKLFTDLDKLIVGDVFMLHVLDKTLAYEVDQILIVEPHETQALMIQEGEDLCTLFTCTPYGINTHRLLVRGHRVELEEETTVRLTADATQIEPMLVAPIAAIPILIVFLSVLISRSNKKRRGDMDDEI